MEKLKNADSLFVGRFMIVAKKENEIADRQTGEIAKYWEYSLSNGKDVLKVTCGKNSPLHDARFGGTYDMEFTADFSRGYAKLKVTYIDGLEDAKPVEKK